MLLLMKGASADGGDGLTSAATGLGAVLSHYSRGNLGLEIRKHFLPVRVV